MSAEPKSKSKSKDKKSTKSESKVKKKTTTKSTSQNEKDKPNTSTLENNQDISETNNIHPITNQNNNITNSPNDYYNNLPKTQNQPQSLLSPLQSKDKCDGCFEGEGTCFCTNCGKIYCKICEDQIHMSLQIVFTNVLLMKFLI